MRQLFLASELLDLVVAEGEQDFDVLQTFRELCRLRVIDGDTVVVVSSRIADGHCDNIEVTGLRWNRLRRHDFFSYVPELARQFNIVGVEGEPPSLKPSSAGEACASGARCTSMKCREDGNCRRQGVDLISPCTSDTSLER